MRFAARDPGAANVLAAFLRRAGSDREFDVDIWALPRAADVFRKTGLEVRELADGVDAPALSDAWSRTPADRLVTGTSHYAPFEPILWDLARRADCASLAVLDQWSNLPRRFAVGRPDAVGAIDAFQAGELTTVGFSPDDVLTVGHPWLAELVCRAAGEPPAARAGDDRASVHALFVSEPIAATVAGGFNDPYGFDELDAFSLLHRAAARVAVSGRAVDVAVKLHPYEDRSSFGARLAALEPVAGLTVSCLDLAAPPHEWVRWADLVAGMTSMLLLEAMVLGRPVVSVQPGLARENQFAPARSGCAVTLTDAEHAAGTLAGLIDDAGQRDALRRLHEPFVAAIPRDSISPIRRWITGAIRHS